MLNILKLKKNYFNTNRLYVDNKTKNNKIKNDKVFPWNMHYPPNTQEWSNSVYTYNKNYIKNIPSINDIINNVMLTFFNMTFLFTKNIKSARKRIEYKRKLINKLFVSKALIKHTNNKAIITIFTYNRERLFLTNKIYDTYMELKNIQKIEPDCLDLNKYIFKNIYMLYLAKNTLKKKTTILVSRILKNSCNINKKKNYEIRLLLGILEKKSIANIKSFLNFFSIINNKYKQYNNIIFDLQELYYYQNKILLLNSYKYKDFFLLQVKSTISKITNKNIEFKVINLKKLSLNSDIFTEAVVKKLKNRKNTLLNVLNKSLSLIKPVPFNKYKLLNHDLENKKNSYYINLNKHKFNEFLNQTFSYNNSINIINKLDENIIYNLKNKFIKGAKLQAKGRLTTRLIASRSVNKFKYKGNLKNIDSSYKNLSTVLLKGYEKSNIQYTVVNSVRRNGTFGLKGWISSY